MIHPSLQALEWLSDHSFRCPNCSALCWEGMAHGHNNLVVTYRWCPQCDKFVRWANYPPLEERRAESLQEALAESLRQARDRDYGEDRKESGQ